MRLSSAFCMTPGISMVADNQGNLAGELSDPLSIKEINEAVIVFRNKNSHARAVI